MGSSFETVAGMIREVLGDDLDPGQQITPDTAFTEGLELESIELVALAEKLQAHYGDRVDFVAWLATKDLDDVLRLTVGEVVEYIDRCLSSKPTG